MIKALKRRLLEEIYTFTQVVYFYGWVYYKFVCFAFLWFIWKCQWFKTLYSLFKALKNNQSLSKTSLWNKVIILTSFDDSSEIIKFNVWKLNICLKANLKWKQTCSV